jgi:hypothetical protein
VTTVTNPDTGNTTLKAVPVAESTDPSMFLMGPVELTATGVALAGGVFSLWAWWANRPALERWGGLAFTVSGLITAGAAMMRHQQAKKAITQ